MNYPTSSNIIIGSKLALAISKATGSPVRRSLETASICRNPEFKEMDRRCEDLKNKSLKLLNGLRADDALVSFNSASMRSAADCKATKRMGKMMRRAVAQQVSLHSKMVKLLDSMILQIGGKNHSNP